MLYTGMTEQEYESAKVELAELREWLNQLLKMGANDESVVDRIRATEFKIRKYESEL